jgi:flagella basal body P-ring formation protein FlgA
MHLHSCRWGAVALIFAASPMYAAETEETVVQLYPTATVTADEVTLSQIAALTGEGAQLAGNWAITAAPAPGRETSIDQNSIQQALVRKGINASTWVFRGSSRCRISRPMPARGQETPRAEISDTPTVSTPPAPAVTTAPADAPATPQPADTLEAAIREHLTERLSFLGGKLAIQMSPAIRELLQLSRPAYDFSIADRGEPALGLVPLDITIHRDGRVEQTRSILAEVSLLKPVVMAAGTINRGQTIGPEHVVLKEQAFDRADRIGSGDLKAFVGQRAVRFINKNELLTTRDIEPLPLIIRNDLVTVIARRGGIEIKGVGRAMASASYGQNVELRNELSKQTFVAVVTGPKTAELAADPGPAAQAVSMAGGND